MRQFTDVEKQQLAGKITKEQKRQQTLRKVNREANWEFIPNPWNYGFFEHLWNYGFLGIILWLLARNVFHYIHSSNKDLGSLLIALMLLFNHIAFFLTKTGWKHRVMKTVAWVWMVFVFVYIYISWDA